MIDQRDTYILLPNHHFIFAISESASYNLLKYLRKSISQMNKTELSTLIDSMKSFYQHSADVYYVDLADQFDDIDPDATYSDEDVQNFFAKHNDLYESGWLDGYAEAIVCLQDVMKRMS